MRWALVVLAACASHPPLQATVVGRQLEAEYVKLRVAPRGWTLPPVESGQTVLLGLPTDAARVAGAEAETLPAAPGALVRRRYTIISPPGQGGDLEVAVRLRPRGVLSPRLHELRDGDPVWMSPTVEGTPQRTLFGDRQLVLVASGIGVTHFISFVRAPDFCRPDRRVVLLHGGTTPAELWFGDELEAAARRCPTFTYLPTLIGTATIEELWARRTVERLWGVAPTPATTHVSMCATLELVEHMIDILGAEGYHPGREVDWCEVD